MSPRHGHLMSENHAFRIRAWRVSFRRTWSVLAIGDDCACGKVETKVYSPKYNSPPGSYTLCAAVGRKYKEMLCGLPPPKRGICSLLVTAIVRDTYSDTCGQGRG